MKKVFEFEIYTTSPDGSICGWGIEMRSVLAESKKEAVIKLKQTPLFDEIILFNYELDLGSEYLNELQFEEMYNKGYTDIRN